MVLFVSCGVDRNDTGSVSKVSQRLVAENTDGVSFLWNFTGEDNAHIDEPGQFVWLVGDFGNPDNPSVPDGKMDLARRYVNASSGPANKVLLSKGDGTFVDVPSDSYNGANGDGVTWYLSGDFDGDGFTDLVRRHKSGGSGNKILISNGNGTFTAYPSHEVGGINDERYWWTTGDMDADGDTDLIRRDANGTYNKILLAEPHPTTGNPTFVPYNSDSFGGGAGDGRYMFLTGDFDGDCRTDLIRRDGLGQYHKIFWGGETNGTSFDVDPLLEKVGTVLTPLGGINGDGQYHWLAGDFDGEPVPPNGCSRTDLVRRSANGQGNRLLIATGSRASFHFQVIQQTSPADTLLGVNGDGMYQWFVADFNGDGKDDLTRRQANGLWNKLLVAKADGNGFETIGASTGDLLGFTEVVDQFVTPPDPMPGEEIEEIPPPEEFQWFVGDFTGDGLPDMARRSKDGAATVEDADTQIASRNLVLINNFDHRYNQYHVAEELFLGNPLADDECEEPIHSFRIPAIVTATTGRLLAFAEGRTTSNYDHGEIDLVLKTSDDDGRTWSGLRRLVTTSSCRQGYAEWYLDVNDDEGIVGNPTPVVDERTGKIWLFFVYMTSTANVNHVWDAGERRIYSTSSTDNGATWSQPVPRPEVSMDVMDQPEKVEGSTDDWDVNWNKRRPIDFDNVGPGNGIFIAGDPAATNSPDWLIIPSVDRNIYSLDHGETWTFASTRNSKGGESAIVLASDGRLIRNDRTNQPQVTRRDAWLVREYLSSTAEWKISHSHSASVPWSYDDNPPDPKCQGSILRLPTTENNIVFLNPGTAVDRHQMVVRLSNDDTESWAHQRTLDYRKGGYSSMTPCGGDGEYICAIHEWDRRGAAKAYNEGDHGAPWTIVFRRFNLDWLKDENLTLGE